MADKSWKAMERRVAKALGTVRNSLSGSRSKAGSSSDTLHEKLYVECKYRQKIATIEWFQDIIPKAKLENKIPILVLKALNHKDDYVVIRLRDLI